MGVILADAMPRDHLYFDRVHIFAPVLHQRRYFSWARQAEKTRSSTCLQHAMWTLAASLSVRFQGLADSLYTLTREMLEALEHKESKVECIDVKQPQAWILLAIYEMMRTNTRRGWMSAGRAFRLVQLTRLYELDGPSLILTQSPSVSQAEWIETEEKRRTFWMAYCIDRFVSVPKGWPLTLNEQVVRLAPNPPVSQSFISRLPVPVPVPDQDSVRS
jgi:Fungal specific transcription factor domain